MNALTMLYRLVGLLVVVAVGGAPLAVASAVTPPMSSLAPTPPAPAPRPDAPELAPVTTYHQDMGDYELFIECSGEGSPTVLLAAGLRMQHVYWWSIQSDVAQFTRFCSYYYDTPRVYYPDTDLGFPGTSQEVVQDLHAALGNASIHGPFVLVGNGVGGLNARMYADQYPDEVVGMVLVGAMHEDQDARLLALLPPAPVPRIPAYQLTMQDVELDQLRAWLGRTAPYPSVDSEGLEWLPTFAQLRATGSLGDLPLVVLTPEWSMLEEDGVLTNVLADPAELRHVLLELQRDLAQRSTNSTHIIVEGSDPLVYDDHPEVVIAAIHQVLDAARTGTRVDGAPVTALPGTGAPDSSTLALGTLSASLLLLASGYMLRRRGHTT